MIKSIHYTAIVLLALLMLHVPASADLIVTYSETYTDNSVSPSASGDPWLTAVFQDKHPYGNGVLLTLAAGNLSDSEFVSNWFFSLREDLDVADLEFEHIDGLAPKETKTREEGFKNPGGGIPMELWFKFENSEGKHKDDRFMAEGYSQILITGIDGLVSQDFNRAIDPLDPLWVSVAHVQATGGGGKSAWVRGDDPPPPTSVPEPSAWLLMALGLTAIPLARRLTK